MSNREDRIPSLSRPGKSDETSIHIVALLLVQYNDFSFPLRCDESCLLQGSDHHGSWEGGLCRWLRVGRLGSLFAAFPHRRPASSSTTSRTSVPDRPRM